MGCSPPNSFVHGVSQVRILKWLAISFSRGTSRPRDQTLVSRLGRQMFKIGVRTPLTNIHFCRVIKIINWLSPEIPKSEIQFFNSLSNILLQITPIVSEYPVSVLQKLNTASVSNAENSTKKISWLLSLTDRQDKQAYWQWGQELMIYEKQVSESNVFQNLAIHS